MIPTQTSYTELGAKGVIAISCVGLYYPRIAIRFDRVWWNREPKSQQTPSANWLVQQSALTSRICSIVEHEVSKSRVDATITARHRAREIATFSRLREYRNSICRGRSSPEDVAIEISTTAAS
jgi:hypothetical protein